MEKSQDLAFVCQSLRWKCRKSLAVSLISNQRLLGVQTEGRLGGLSRLSSGPLRLLEEAFLFATSRAGNGGKENEVQC